MNAQGKNMFRKASSISLVVIVVLVNLLLWCQSAFAFECPNAVDVIVSAPNPSVYVSDIVAVGAYVMVLLTNDTATFSRFSFSYGSSFPSSTSKVLPESDNLTKMKFVSDGRDVLAVGLLKNKLQSLEFSFSDFSWSSSSVIFDGPVNHVSCGAKLGLVVCAVANDTAVAEGMQIFSYNTSQLNRTNLVWQKRTASGLPVTKSKPGVGSDGSGFMVCSIGDSGGTKLICSKSTNGIDDYSHTVTQPAPPSNFTASDSVAVASNGVPGMYMVAFTQGVTIGTRITSDTGNTWGTGPDLPLTSLPSLVPFASTIIAVSQHTGFANITFLSNLNPVEFDTPVKLMDGNNVSFASGHFRTNFHAASNHAGSVLVRSCIPTAGPTLSPSPSPTKVGGTATTPSAARSVALVVTLLAMLASFY